MKRELIIHIGLMKTGSTKLQRNYFPMLKNYRYLGKDDGLVDVHLSNFYEFIGSLAFGKNETLFSSFRGFNEFLTSEEERRYGTKDNSVPLLISHEGFTRFLFHPIYEGIYGFWTADPKLVFSRLHEYGKTYNFNIKIILIKRNPSELLHSFYTQMFFYYTQNKHISNLKDYLKKVATDELDQFGLSYLFNNKLENTLIRLFSKENVFCFDFHEIYKDNQHFNKHFAFIFNQEVKNFNVNKIENKKSYTHNVKKGSIKPHWLKSEGFIKSMNLAGKKFLYHFLPPEKQKKEIVWDEECEALFNKIESMNKNQRSWL